MSLHDCLKKTYVKLSYVPPLFYSFDSIGVSKMLANPDPKDCTKVKFIGSPEIKLDPITGIDLVCAEAFTSGVGGVNLLLQITAFVVWQIEFVNKNGYTVYEWPSVLVSLPVLYKLEGPRMALMAVSPAKIKLIGYAGAIASALNKIEEIEKVIKLIVVFKKTGFCSTDIEALEAGLKFLETELNNLIQGVAYDPDPGNIAKRMEHKPHGTARFAASRFA